jgi:hypothetical protein
LVRYLNDFATKTGLNILYGMNVLNIDKIDNINNINYKLKVKNKDNEEEIYECNKLICATGLSKPNIKIFNDVKVPIKHYYDYEKDYFLDEENLKEFINKRILIIGGGNAGYELANLLTNYGSHVRIYYKEDKNFSISSNYTGDVRAVYLPFLDTFFLKSLNSIYSGSDIKIIQENEDSKYEVFIFFNKLIVCEDDFDKIILATGWKFDKSIFNFEILTSNKDKYPTINHKYESYNNKNLFFIGTLMHSLDYKVSSGGFIHGFRYLIKYFVNLNYDRIFNIIDLDYKNLENIVELIIFRINNTSAIYQMHSVLGDILAFDKITKEIKYVSDVSVDFFKFNKIFSDKIDKIFMIITLEFSKKKITNIQDLGGKFSSTGFENNSKYLHPIFRIYDFNNLIEEIHLDEELNAEFIYKETYYDRIIRILKMFIY